MSVCHGFLKHLATWVMSAVALMPSYLLAEDSVLIVANESMPFNGVIKDETNFGTVVTNRGMTFEILEAATQYGAPEFKYELGLPWRRAQITVQQAQDQKIAIVPFTRTEEREASQTWIAQLFSYQPRLNFYNQPAPSLEEAKQLTVGVIIGSAHIPFLTSIGFNQLQESDSAQKNAMMLKLGRFDAIYESQFVDTYHWKEAGYDANDLAYLNIGEPKHIYIAANLDFPKETALRISEAITKLQESGELQRIIDKWH